MLALGAYQGGNVAPLLEITCSGQRRAFCANNLSGRLVAADTVSRKSSKLHTRTTLTWEFLFARFQLANSNPNSHYYTIPLLHTTLIFGALHCVFKLVARCKIITEHYAQIFRGVHNMDQLTLVPRVKIWVDCSVFVPLWAWAKNRYICFLCVDSHAPSDDLLSDRFDDRV